MEFYIGQICLFPWDWAPIKWAKCDGSLVSIAENQALFALIGTEFGGDGRETFALPRMEPIKCEGHDADVSYFINLHGLFPPRA